MMSGQRTWEQANHEMLSALVARQTEANATLDRIAQAAWIVAGVVMLAALVFVATVVLG